MLVYQRALTVFPPLNQPRISASLLRHGTGDAALIVKGGRAERRLDAFGGDVLTSETTELQPSRTELPVACYTNGILIPEDPCMVYLPTLAPKVIQNNPNVGKYSIHGSLGNGIVMVIGTSMVYEWDMDRGYDI